ncbi:MAG: hypothetical protein HGA65_03975 [Oscillochloris sp.]|nr:hypothetical protein [Oscillochloris sp.]
MTSGAVQSHTFHTTGDVDWITFTASSGSTYTIDTLNLQTNTDTVLTLYTADASTVLMSNDDVDSTRASRITWLATGSGTFYVRVSNYGSRGGVNFGYQVRLTVSAPQTSADAFEPDNSLSSARLITVGGAIQNHNFH